jgi:hypothetical protein
MNSPNADIKSAAAPSNENDELTGLPWLRTWRGVYFFVFGCFVLWVALMLALTMRYS